MTALSPAEEAMVSRMGLFDEDVLTDLENSDVVGCCITDCREEAWWRISTYCCGRRWEVCTPHKGAHRERNEARLAAKPQHCTTCNRNFPAGTAYEDVFRVGPL